jgi:hypothetical protein
MGQMVAGSDLGHNTAKGLVEICLRVNKVA